MSTFSQAIGPLKPPAPLRARGSRGWRVRRVAARSSGHWTTLQRCRSPKRARDRQKLVLRFVCVHLKTVGTVALGKGPL